MTDPLAGLNPDGSASEPPAAPAFDIEKVKAEIAAENEERIKGFQRLLAGRDEVLEALRGELDQFKTAGLSEEEREQLEISKKDSRIQELEAQLELNALAGQYGTEMPYFQRLLASESAEDQLKVMREYAQTLVVKAEPPEADPAKEEFDPSGVDMNRPPRKFESGTLLDDGTRMTDALADRLLASVSRQADVTQRRIRPSN